MKRIISIALSMLAVSAVLLAQAPDQAAIDKALMAAPRNMKEGATVIKWKADYTYETLKKGANRLISEFASPGNLGDSIRPLLAEKP